MVSELDITNQDVAKIAEMIDAEIAALVPDWKTDHNVTESDSDANKNKNNAGFCGNCASNGYIQETVSSNSEISGEKSHHHHQFDCSDENKSCSSVHGRFEEISYQVEGQEQHGSVDVVLVVSGEEGNNGIHYADIWGLRDSRSDDGQEEQNPRKVKGEWWSENEIRRELRWLKARHKIQLTRVRDQTMCETSKEISSGEKFEIGTSASPPLLYRAISLPVDAVDI